MRLAFTTISLALLSLSMLGQGQVIPQEAIDFSRIDGQDDLVGVKVLLPIEVRERDINDDFIQKDGDYIWTYSITTEGVGAMIPYFDELRLGAGSRIRARSPNGTQSTRWFSNNGNEAVGSFALPYIVGNELVIEISCSSQSAIGALELTMTEVGLLQSGFGDALPCFANVNCPEGDDWSDTKRSVARYMTVLDGQLGFCSGSLVNNTNEDCANYFLSAQHCAIGSTPAELGQYVFYFNYEASECSDPTDDIGLDQQTVVGCTKLASSGASTTFPPDRSDYVLLLLNEIPDDYNVYYAGWNRSPLAQLEGLGAIIQHPQADLKKLSFWDDVTISSTSQDHLYVYAVASANGEGVVEPNSSGSPIFDVDHNIVGNVTAGSSECISAAGQDPFAVGGRFEIHWDQCGSTDDRQLEPWLDPIGSAVLSLDGKNNCGPNALDEFWNDRAVLIYPNPSSEWLYVRSADRVRSIDIHAVDGKLLLSEQNTDRVDISSLAPGVHLLTVTTSDFHYSRHILIE